MDLSKRLKVTKFINSGSIDEIFVDRCIKLNLIEEINNFQHLEYGIAKLATRDVLSFKSYVENIDFVHTQTSIAIDHTLQSKNFVEKNLNMIMNGKKYEIPMNTELCNISTNKSVAKNIYHFAKYGENQNIYYTGTKAVFSLENYFKFFQNILNDKPLNYESIELIDKQVLNYSDFNKIEADNDFIGEEVAKELTDLIETFQIQ